MPGHCKEDDGSAVTIFVYSPGHGNASGTTLARNRHFMKKCFFEGVKSLLRILTQKWVILAYCIGI